MRRATSAAATSSSRDARKGSDDSPRVAAHLRRGATRGSPCRRCERTIGYRHRLFALSREVHRPMEKASVYVHGEQEALKYKWIESEKAGYDLGEDAIRRWVKCHWWGFLRARWLEHLQGN